MFDDLVMMFSTVYPEADGALEVLKSRIKQAAAGGVGQVLTFGHTKGPNWPTFLAFASRYFHPSQKS
jgi:hypothetical protein